MELSLTSIKKAIVHGLHRYHVIIFVVVVLGSLGGVVLLLNNIVTKSGAVGDYTTSAEGSTFDKTTIDRLNRLKSRDETPTPLDLSKGRTNPFVE